MQRLKIFLKQYTNKLLQCSKFQYMHVMFNKLTFNRIFVVIGTNVVYKATHFYCEAKVLLKMPFLDRRLTVDRPFFIKDL